jgi:hypothetical protein
MTTTDSPAIGPHHGMPMSVPLAIAKTASRANGRCGFRDCVDHHRDRTALAKALSATAEDIKHGSCVGSLAYACPAVSNSFP